MTSPLQLCHYLCHDQNRLSVRHIQWSGLPTTMALPMPGKAFCKAPYNGQASLSLWHAPCQARLSVRPIQWSGLPITVSLSMSWSEQAFCKAQIMPDHPTNVVVSMLDDQNSFLRIRTILEQNPVICYAWSSSTFQGFQHIHVLHLRWTCRLAHTSSRPLFSIVHTFLITHSWTSPFFLMDILLHHPILPPGHIPGSAYTSSKPHSWVSLYFL